MAVIEKHIHEHFASLAEEGAAEEVENIEASSHISRGWAPPPPQILDAPFAKVNTVATGSPADSAGLKAGDQLRNFGYVNHTNHDSLRRVGECVQGNEGVSCLLVAHEPHVDSYAARGPSESFSVIR